MDKYIKEGMTSFHKNKGRYVNPYEIGSEEYNSFERGWTQALKRCDEGLLQEYRNESRRDIPE